MSRISHDRYLILLILFQGDSNLLMETANKVYIDSNFTLNRVFEFKASEYFSTLPDKVEFSLNPESARKQINNWVEAKTNSKIKNLLPSGSVTSNTKMVLVNALYFKGSISSILTRLETKAIGLSALVK